jgi:hypothetical protein
MKGLLGRRRRGGGRKGERHRVALGVDALRELLETDDADEMLAKLAVMDIHPWVSGYSKATRFIVFADEFPEGMRQRAIEAAARDDGWRGFFDTK